MIDNLLGRPSRRIKRYQTIFLLLLWFWVLAAGPPHGPRLWPVRWLGRRLRRVTPWQLVVGTLVSLYGLKNIDSILNLAPPEPLARMYNRNFYRATWINCALDTAFTTAMPIRPKWLRDLCSVLFTPYFLVFDRAADERLRKYRAYSTIDMLRTQWHKTTNPYIRFFCSLTWARPKLVRKLLLPRPPIGAYARRPVQAMLFFDGTYAQLRDQHQLILDFPGGGWISMSPEHHEERLRQTAKETGKVVLSLNYAKAPEFVFPYAQEECFDAYRILQMTKGRIIGMSGQDDFQVIITGDSAGGHMASSCTIRTIEYPDTHVVQAFARPRTSWQEHQYSILGLEMDSVPPPLPKPVGLLLAYPSVNLSYSVWLDPETLRVLRKQSERSLHEMGTPADTIETSLLDNQAAEKAPSGGTRPRSRSRSGSRLSRKLSAAELRHFRRTSGSFHDLPAAAGKPFSAITPFASYGDKEGKNQQEAKEIIGTDDRVSSKDNKSSPATHARPGMSRTKSLTHFSSLASEARKHLAERAESSRAVDADETNDAQPAAANSTDSTPEPDQARVPPALFADPTLSGLPGLVVGMSPLLEDREGEGKEGLLSKSYASGGTPSRSPSLMALRKKDEQLQRVLAQTKADEDARLEQEQQQQKPGVETRLTMSSTTAYFQDRILTPGMMRSMAILYIGPHRQPDLDHNYLLSPLKAPAHILAQFPPTLVICGEKDPLCDDSVVLAGRIWEAKMARRAAVERRKTQRAQHRRREKDRSAAGSRTSGTPFPSSARVPDSQELQTENSDAEGTDDEEWDEPEEEFVHLRILEGWSHGFMQMSSIMPEAIKVIRFLGIWMTDTFDLYEEHVAEEEDLAAKAFQKQLVTPMYNNGPGKLSPHPGRLPAEHLYSPSLSYSPNRSPASGPSRQTLSPADSGLGNVADVAGGRARRDGPLLHRTNSSDAEDGGLVFTPRRDKSLTSSPAQVDSPRVMENTTPTYSGDDHGCNHDAHNKQIHGQSSNQDSASSSAASKSDRLPVPTHQRLDNTFRSASKDPSPSVSSSVSGRASGTPNTSHSNKRAERPGRNTAADAETRDMLIAQRSLFQRRREAVTYGLDASTLTHDSEDEGHDHSKAVRKEREGDEHREEQDW